MEKIRRSPVEVGSLSHYLEDFIHLRWLFVPSTVSPLLTSLECDLHHLNKPLRAAGLSCLSSEVAAPTTATKWSLTITKLISCWACNSHIGCLWMYIKYRMQVDVRLCRQVIIFCQSGFDWHRKIFPDTTTIWRGAMSLYLGLESDDKNKHIDLTLANLYLASTLKTSTC